MVTDQTDEDIQAAWQRLANFVAAARDDEFLRTMARRLDDELVAEVPEFAHDKSIRADLDSSTYELLAAYFRVLSGTPQLSLEIPAAVLELARTVALRHHDVSVLLRAYRIGQRLAWAELVAILDREIPDAELRINVLSLLFDQLSREIERVVDASVAVYTEERDRWLNGALARKVDLIQAILRSEPIDPDEATRILSHRLQRHQLALILWSEESGPERGALGQLESTAREAAALLGSPPPLTMPDGSRSLQAWITLQPEQELSALDELFAKTRGVWAATGLPTYGLTGFRTSHRQAQLAAKVAQVSSKPRQVTHYGDVALVAQFLSDPETMKDLVTRELRGLDQADELSARLRETALAYLRSGGKARDAAAALGVHKNTVLYRLRSIEEALGSPIEARRLPREMALEIIEVLGDGVLPSD